MTAVVADDESRRLTLLHETQVLDTPPEPDFDDLATLAAEVCRMPIGLVSLIDADRQWTKARVGWELIQTSRAASFCTHTVQTRQLLEVEDATGDPRFADSPLVRDEGVRFYAGAPLLVDRQAVGTVCVMDRRPRQLTGTQRRILRALARHAGVELDLRRYARQVGDLTERLRDLDRLKENFIANVSHELRTPLASIRGYLEVLLDGDVDPDAARRFLTVMQRNADRLLHLVDDLLLVTRLPEQDLDLDPIAVDLAELAYQATLACRPLAEHKNITVTEHTEPPVPVHADPPRLRQALNHLLFNAVKFTPDGGQVTVRVVDDGTDDGGPTVTITDTGVGIPETDLPHLFNRFHRGATSDALAAQGVGLGLTIVKAIIDAHHGTISIDRRADQGTTVTVTLPRAMEPPTP